MLWTIFVDLYSYVCKLCQVDFDVLLQLFNWYALQCFHAKPTGISILFYIWFSNLLVKCSLMFRLKPCLKQKHSTNVQVFMDKSHFHIFALFFCFLMILYWNPLLKDCTLWYNLFWIRGLKRPFNLWDLKPNSFEISIFNFWFEDGFVLIEAQNNVDTGCGYKYEYWHENSKCD